MDEVGCDELREKGGEHICEKDNTLWDIGTDEVECSREDDNVGDIVDEACGGE